MTNKVKIYRRGEVPTFVNQHDEKKDEDFKIGQQQTNDNFSIDELQKQINDRRLQRLQSKSADKKEDRIERRRQLIAEIIEDTPNNNNEKEEVVDDLRFERLKIARMKAEEEKNTGELPLEDEEDHAMEHIASSSESESSSDGDEGDFPMEPVLELKFVPKTRRTTIKTEDQIKVEEEIDGEKKKKEVNERKQRTIDLIKNQVEVDNNTEEKDEFDFSSSEEDNEETQQREFELWKLRELFRLKREYKELEEHRTEQEEKERRQKLTDVEVQKENEKAGRGEKERTPFRFLQKYYHKGAFYHDEYKDIHNKNDWATPTGEDAYTDRTILPRVMQVKNFGKASRTKYTHLSNEDTSAIDDPWRSGFITDSYKNKMGGMKSAQRPNKRRKLN
jgi:microfibrillar-associated protein 1